MNKKLVLTSIIISSIIGVVHAEQFPSNGAMQENTTTVEYDDILYQIMAGQYLPAGSETAIPCTSGNYCSGLTDATYNATQNQGLTSCPSSHPNSMAGASSDTQCYTSCTLQGANIAHATSVSGNDYYGTGTDTCGATACENGYYVKNRLRLVEQMPLIPVDYSDRCDSYAYISYTGGSYKPDSRDPGLTDKNTWAAFHDNDTIYGRASCQPTMSSNTEGAEYAATNYMAVLKGAMSVEEFKSGLAALSDEYKAEFMVEILDGLQNGTKNELDVYNAVYSVFDSDMNANYSTKSRGTHCYCQLMGFISTDGIYDEILSAPWVYYSSDSLSSCLLNCAKLCATGLLWSSELDEAYRAALYGSFGVLSVTTCDANEINITWQDADQADVDANNAGMCTYDGEIRTPVKAATKPGKTFKGWRFEKK